MYSGMQLVELDSLETKEERLDRSGLQKCQSIPAHALGA
jgi:hypothetical protein